MTRFGLALFLLAPLAPLALALALAMPAAAEPSLYDDLGAKDGVTRIVNDMVDLVLADQRIGDSFSESNIPRIRAMLYEQFCELSGGPCTYSGRPMGRSHKPLHLRDAHFNALVEDLEQAMDKSGVAWPTQARLLALLAPMRRDVVSE